MKILNTPVSDYDIVNKKYVDENASGGDTLPIGAITEFDGDIIPEGYEEVSEMSGSNSNGSWVKFADGTMICTKRLSIITPITTAWGSLYESGKVSLGNFPQPFISKPILSVTNNSSAGALIEAVFDGTGTFVGDCWLCRGTSRNSTDPYWLDIVAIGRWK